MPLRVTLQRKLSQIQWNHKLKSTMREKDPARLVLTPTEILIYIFWIHVLWQCRAEGAGEGGLSPCPLNCPFQPYRGATPQMPSLPRGTLPTPWNVISPPAPWRSVHAIVLWSDEVKTKVFLQFSKAYLKKMDKHLKKRTPRQLLHMRWICHALGL